MKQSVNVLTTFRRLVRPHIIKSGPKHTHTVLLNSILKLSSHILLFLGLSNILYPSDFYSKILYIFLVSSVCVLLPTVSPI
jgi:hypothetical protein